MKLSQRRQSLWWGTWGVESVLLLATLWWISVSGIEDRISQDATGWKAGGLEPGARRDEGGAIVAEIQREFRLEAGKPLELDL